MDLATTSGMIRGKDGTFTFFSHPGAPSFTQARAVNNKGLVSGFRDTSTGLLTGFIYDPKTETFTDVVPSLFTIEHGINSKGEAVGSAVFSNADDPCPGSLDPFVTYGWLRAVDGSITYFQVNGEVTRARGINDAGSIVGWVDDSASGKSKGFVVKLDGSPCESLTVAGSDLLEFPGFDFTIPEGITNSGVIVGIVEDANAHGFIATPRTGPLVAVFDYVNDFSSSVGSASLFGAAVLDSGNVRLTDNINGQLGSLVIDDLVLGGAVASFTATFDLQTGPGSIPPADGISFNFGQLPNIAVGEEGTGDGLTISFDTFDNGLPDHIGIDVLLNGTVVASDGTNPFTNGVFVPVSVVFDADGTLDLTFDGAAIFTNLPTGFTPATGDRFGFGGRTGGSKEENRIDNVSIFVVPQ
jgi:hypothetical protein